MAQYLVPLENLSPDVLIGRFKQLENDVERLRPYIKAELDKYRQALDTLFATLLAETDAAGVHCRGVSGPISQTQLHTPYTKPLSS